MMNENLIIPRHVAFIMDGNNRWAKKNETTLKEAYMKGIERCKDCIEYGIKKKIKLLSFFALSIENLMRPNEDLVLINEILKLFLNDILSKDLLKKVKIKFIGNIDLLDNEIYNMIKRVEIRSDADFKITVNIFLNYSGKDEIKKAAQEMAIYYINEFKNSQNNKKDLFEGNKIYDDFIKKDTITDPDFLIRTGGDMRISNFMLWHISYTELYFDGVFWPDFDEFRFDEALVNYSKRKRTFGLRL